MPDTLSVFINAQKVVVPTGARVRDALAAWNADAAREVESGARIVTDNRGLPIDVDTPLHGGAIFRLVSARERARDDDDLLH
ncbi:MAG: hypothetical protein M3081_05000 [Gemmatimonadota bacterium]|nr:hypothetical protein [Gemmatimonadota bacterium]